jgi:hypothetical protein
MSRRSGGRPATLTRASRFEKAYGRYERLPAKRQRSDKAPPLWTDCLAGGESGLLSLRQGDE